MLNKQILKKGIEDKLKAEFKKDSVKTSLRKYLDGGGLVGLKTNAKSIDKALGNISNATMVVGFGTADNLPSQIISKSLIKKVTANEWANAISHSIAEWMSSDIAPIMAQAIADEVDKFLKTADVKVTIPPGLVSQGAGPAAVPNVAPLPIMGMPNNPLQQGGIT